MPRVVLITLLALGVAIGRFKKRVGVDARAVRPSMRARPRGAHLTMSLSSRTDIPQQVSVYADDVGHLEDRYLGIESYPFCLGGYGGSDLITSR